MLTFSACYAGGPCADFQMKVLSNCLAERGLTVPFLLPGDAEGRSQAGGEVGQGPSGEANNRRASAGGASTRTETRAPQRPERPTRSIPLQAVAPEPMPVTE